MDLVSTLVNLFNNFFFIALPYIAVIVFLVGTIYRYRSTSFKYSSFSSQFCGRGASAVPLSHLSKDSLAAREGRCKESPPAFLPHPAMFAISPFTT